MKYAIATYVVIGILTFGHAAANVDYKDYKDFNSQSGASMGAGFGGFIFWPLYWSWELQE